jgi:hypothetical protein
MMAGPDMFRKFQEVSGEAAKVGQVEGRLARSAGRPSAQGRDSGYLESAAVGSEDSILHLERRSKTPFRYLGGGGGTVRVDCSLHSLSLVGNPVESHRGRNRFGSGRGCGRVEFSRKGCGGCTLWFSMVTPNGSRNSSFLSNVVAASVTGVGVIKGVVGSERRGEFRGERPVVRLYSSSWH